MIPVIMTIAEGRPELVDQALRTLYANTKYPHKFYIQGSNISPHQHIQIRNRIIYYLKDWEYVVSVDDDVYFTEGWLEKLIETHKRHPEIYALEAIGHYRGLMIEDKGDIVTEPKLAGPCVSMSRQLFDKIGQLPTRRLWTRGVEDKLARKGIARLKDDTVVVHCGIRSVDGRLYPQEFVDYTKALAEKVGAITN